MTTATRPEPAPTLSARMLSIAVPVVFGIAGAAYGLTVLFVGDGSTTTWFSWSDASGWAVLAPTALVQAGIFAVMVAHSEFPRRHRPHWLGRPSARALGLALGLAFGAVGVPLVASFLVLPYRGGLSPLDAPPEVLQAVGFTLDHVLLRLAIVGGVAMSFAIVQRMAGMHVGHAAAVGLLMLVSACTLLGGVWFGLAAQSMAVGVCLVLAWRSRIGPPSWSQ